MHIRMVILFFIYCDCFLLQNSCSDFFKVKIIILIYLYKSTNLNPSQKILEPSDAARIQAWGHKSGPKEETSSPSQGHCAGLPD